jgi:hypothetical protein
MKLCGGKSECKFIVEEKQFEKHINSSCAEAWKILICIRYCGF